MTAALEEGEWSPVRPGRTLPPGRIRYPFYRRLGGPQGRSGRAENLFPAGIRSRTVQPVVSRYTNWATRPTTAQCNVPLVRADSICWTELLCLKLFAKCSDHSQPWRQTFPARAHTCNHIQYLIRQLVINNNLSFMFLPYVSTSTRSSSGRGTQRHTSTANFVKVLE